MSDDVPKFALMHSRPDGTYVIMYNGLPYHVTREDLLYDEVKAAADDYGKLPPEPPPMKPVLFTED